MFSQQQIWSLNQIHQGVGSHEDEHMSLVFEMVKKRITHDADQLFRQIAFKYVAAIKDARVKDLRTAFRETAAQPLHS